MSNFWQDRPTFVTGASGLLGSWLVRHLLDAGADVVCLVRDWVPQSDLWRSGDLQRVKVVRGDVCDQELLERALGEYEIDTVFHLAAQTTVQVALRNPVSTFNTNIGGTWALFEACRRSPKVAQVVVASSDKTYGEQADLPYTEDAPLLGTYPYDVSKSCVDMLVNSYAKTYALPVAVTRCGNFYGGGDLNWNRIVPGTIRSVIRGENPIIRSDGKFVRDYFYIEDGAAAYMTLAEKLAGNRELIGEAFNFSNEQPMTVIEIAQLVLDVMESGLELDIRNEVSQEILKQYLSAEKARSALGWQPTYGLKEGLRKTVSWYKDFLENSDKR